MLLGGGYDPSGRRRDSNLARFDARINYMVERRRTMSLMSGGLLVREAMDRRCVKLYLSCYRCEAWADHPERPLIAAAIP